MIRRLYAVLFITLALVSGADNAWALNRKCEQAEKFYLRGEYKKAAGECEKLLKKYRSGQKRDEAAHIAALSYLKLQNYAKAREYFTLIVKRSRDKELVREAEIGLTNMSAGGSLPSAVGPSFYSVQVGCFQDKKNADRLYRRFKRRKYTVRIIEQRDGWRTMYKVKIGRFNTRKAAITFTRKLKKSGYEGAIVAF